MIQFWIAMRACFGIAADAQKQFFQLASPGSQGTMSLDQFALRVSELYHCVRYTGMPSPSAAQFVFMGGLNNAATKAHCQQRWDNDNTLTLSAALSACTAF
jgi:hypothetical protein